MEVRLGEKIRLLRQRDGRTQEALANAIGVTSQAVSRWEANGGYPDVESIPAIANYFHVTIDELFGYDGDREAAIQVILEEADANIRKGFDWEQYLPSIKAAAEEYPSDVRIQLRYGLVLLNLGFKRHGERQYKPTTSKDGEGIYSYNRRNEDHTETLKVFERILPDLTESKDRAMVIKHMVRLYAMRGEFDKAEALAQKRDSITVCREVLLPSTTGASEERQKHIGELILALAAEMEKAVVGEVYRNRKLRLTHVGIEKLLMVAELYKSILDDGNYGFGHFVLFDIYYHCAKLAADLDLTEEARQYLHFMKDHIEAYAQVQATGKDFHYTAVLAAGATTPADAMFPVRKGPDSYVSYPDNLKAIMREDTYFHDCVI